MGRWVRLGVAFLFAALAVALAAFVSVPLAYDDGHFAEARVAASGESLELFVPPASAAVGCRFPVGAVGGPWVAWAGAAAAPAVRGAAGGEAVESEVAVGEAVVGGTLIPLVVCSAMPAGLGERALWLGASPPAGAVRGRLLYAGGSARGEFRPLEALWSRGGTRALADALRTLVDGAGPVAPLCFVLLFVVATVLAFPAMVLTVAGAVGFGLWPGFLLVWLGATLGATAAFLVGRYLARGLVERHLSDRLRALDSQLASRALWTVIVLRLLPVVPFLAVNYACGLSRMRLRDFVLGTALGTPPLLFLFVYAASAAWRLHWSQPATWLPLCAALPLLGTPWLWRRVGRRKALAATEPRS